MKKSGTFARRAFFGGLGATIALPFFESLLDRKSALAQAPPGPARKQRFLTIFLPDGVLMEEWVPAQTGPTFTLPPLLAPLAKFQNKLLVLSQLANIAGKPDNGTGDHACGTGACFTAMPPFRGDGAAIKNGISVDQAAANLLKQSTRIGSLQLGLEDGATSGDCEFGFSCLYENAISWASDRQGLPKTTSPTTVFNQIFAGQDANAQVRAEQLARKKSILDYLKQEAALLNGKLGTSDRAKLDQFLTSIRDLETQIVNSGTPMSACTTIPKPPADSTLDLPTRSRLMNDLIAAAFQCDATRVVSHMLGHAFPSRAYSFMGVNAKHHDLSHYADDSGKNDYRKVILWNMNQVADLLGKLDAIADGPGQTILDNTMVLLTSDCGESRNHDHTHIPVLVAGGAGVFKMGRHLAYPKNTPIANLFVSMLNAVGVQSTTFGSDGKAPLANLT
jgi:hypothetical protein